MVTLLNGLYLHFKYLLKLCHEKAGQFNEICPNSVRSPLSVQICISVYVCVLFYSHLLSPSLFVFLAQEGFHWVLSLKNGSGYRDKALFLSESNFQWSPTGNTAHSNDTEFSKHLNLYIQLSPDLTSDSDERWEHKRKVNRESLDNDRTDMRERQRDQTIEINAKMKWKWNRVMNATPRAVLCMSFLVNPSLSIFLPMDDRALCSCCEKPRWPALLHFSWTIQLLHIPLKRHRSVSRVRWQPDYYSISSCFTKKHAYETAQQRIMGKTSEGHNNETVSTHLNRWGWRFHYESLSGGWKSQEPLVPIIANSKKP